MTLFFDFEINLWTIILKQIFQIQKANYFIQK